MKEEIIFWVVYAAGCIIAYPRALASFYEIDEKYCDDIKPSALTLLLVCLFSVFSWIGVFIGFGFYCFADEKYFWKFNRKELFENYYIRNSK